MDKRSSLGETSNEYNQKDRDKELELQSDWRVDHGSK